MSKRFRARIPALAAAVAAAATFGLAVTAPSAEATVTQVSVMPDFSFGPITNYGTTCQYTVRARLTEGLTPVTFYDNGVPFATVAPTDGVALVTWTPTTRGHHTLQAVQPTTAQEIAPWVQVEVGVGMHIGYACLVI
ncbi:Ig-like domain repeat protein [Nocardia cyriacigeorgica]|nr:Ig-like domain repeat protein [Nocardia cyriacigeorgica]MBF6439856.1 Ig-like domain repeat protein [Nocardia cyriacigeorgica]MBF6455884.1 Ig-like domain repeat protein [Nocardia cyriacigeorgica]MBF6477450.1 Ig-like domain repeat protein [Nocardia cyriacigeorgica]MBF6553375.1 Ig-like domain repeat protein [Nocardia cyriacigeorgica]